MYIYYYNYYPMLGSLFPPPSSPVANPLVPGVDVEGIRNLRVASLPSSGLALLCLLAPSTY